MSIDVSALTAGQRRSRRMRSFITQPGLVLAVLWLVLVVFVALFAPVLAPSRRRPSSACPGA
jgi:hypothetical protein